MIMMNCCMLLMFSNIKRYTYSYNSKYYKGKGVSFMENNLVWHYKSPDEEQYKQAIKEIEG